MTPGFGRQGGHAAAETSAPIDRRSARFGIVIVGQRQEHLSNLKKSAVAILATARKAMRCVAAQRFATMRFHDAYQIAQHVYIRASRHS